MCFTGAMGSREVATPYVVIVREETRRRMGLSAFVTVSC